MKKTFIIIYFLFSIISCKKEEYTIENLNGNKISALGHAGMGFSTTYPVNSYESILKCLNLGADGTEIDVQMTKDSVLIAFHDQDLSENTNLKGGVNSLTWNEIKEADYIQTHYLNYSIHSLDQLFSHIENLHTYRFIFDCKLYTSGTNTNQFYTSYMNAVIALMQKFKLQNNVYLASSSTGFISLFKNKNSDYKFLINPLSFTAGFDTALSFKLFGIQMSTNDISREQIKMAHDNNLWVSIWETNSNKDQNKAIKKNPDFIITDNVKGLIKLIK